MSIYQIAVDGPSGSGKSTLAKGVAHDLKIMYLDTGAMYRTCALAALKASVSPRDERAVSTVMAAMNLEVRFMDNTQHMFLDGNDVSGLIRTPEVSVAASDISALAVVRRSMVDMQRKISASQSFVIDGRDIASNVLPNAKYKFYVTAKASTRARRRLAELNERGDFSQKYEEVLRDIEYRDEQDSRREFAPLVRVPEAIVIDTDDFTIEETKNLLLSYIRE